MMPSVSPSQFAATSTLGRCLLALADSVRGDTINTASRMESHGVPGRIQVTQRVHDKLRDQYEFEQRGVITVKGKGDMTTFFLNGPAPAH